MADWYDPSHHRRPRAVPTWVVEHRIVACPDDPFPLGGISLLSPTCFETHHDTISQEYAERKSESTSKGKTLPMCFVTEKHAVLTLSATSLSACTLEKGEPPNADDACVATIRPIRAIAFPVMDVCRREMCQPPLQQTQHEQQTSHPTQRTDLAGFPISASALSLVTRRFHLPTKPLLGKPLGACTRVRHHDPRLNTVQRR